MGWALVDLVVGWSALIRAPHNFLVDYAGPGAYDAEDHWRPAASTPEDDELASQIAAKGRAMLAFGSFIV
jgi:hypothetical protein